MPHVPAAGNDWLENVTIMIAALPPPSAGRIRCIFVVFCWYFKLFSLKSPAAKKPLFRSLRYARNVVS